MNTRSLSLDETYSILEIQRKQILNNYCCREHIVNPVDAKRIMEIEEEQRLIRIETARIEREKAFATIHKDKSSEDEQ